MLAWLWLKRCRGGGEEGEEEGEERKRERAGGREFVMSHESRVYL